MMNLKPMNPVDDDGWSEWVNPKHSQYFAGCCDCGLIHEMQFMVVRFYGDPDESGAQRCHPIGDDNVQTLFRARRESEPLHYLVTQGQVDFAAGSEARHILERVENEEISASKACELICEMTRRPKE